MPRRLVATMAALAVLPLIATSAIAAAIPGQSTSPRVGPRRASPRAAGSTAYVGSLSTGGVAEVNLRTGTVEQRLHRGHGRHGGGRHRVRGGANRLWVAGGNGHEVRVYDAASGEHLERYAFDSGFVNDVVVTGDAVYATDSNMPQLLVIPLGADGSLPAPDDAFALAITGDFVYQPGFNANGIAELAGWLIVPQSITGELFAIDPATGASFQLLPEGSIPSADGLELVGSTLYVVVRSAEFSGVKAYSIRGGVATALGTMTSDSLAVPTTVAFSAGQLWVVNARFGTPVTPETPYWLTRLPARASPRRDLLDGPDVRVQGERDTARRHRGRAERRGSAARRRAATPRRPRGTSVSV